MMKLTHVVSAMAVVAMALTSVASHAALTAVAPTCDSGGALGTLGALDCSGAWGGNNVNQESDVLAQLVTDFNGTVGAAAVWTYVGSTNAGIGTSGPFDSVPADPSGTLTFDAPVTGYFAVTLKAGNQFSLYLFDGGIAGISSIDFTTLGTAVNHLGIPRDLSHASLYTAAVPEAETYAMLLAGLGVVGLMSRRRRLA
jgi:hypothetical protein